MSRDLDRTRGARQRVTRCDARGPGDGLADDDAARHLADHEQPAAGLGVGQQHEVVLADAGPTSRCGRTHSRLRRVPPLTYPSRTASRAPSSSGTAADVEPGAHARGAQHRERGGPSRPKPVTSVAASTPAASAAREAACVERHHRRHRLREDLPGRLVPRVEHPDAQRLGEAERQPGPGGVLAQQPVRVGEAGHRHAVERLRARRWCGPPATGQPAWRATSAPPRSTSASRSRSSTARGQPTRLIASTRLAPHRPHVGHRVGRHDPAPVVGVVDDRGEEVGGADDRPAAVDPHHGRVVAALGADEQVGADRAGRPPRGASRARRSAPCRRTRRRPRTASSEPPCPHPRTTSDTLTNGGVQAPGGPPGLQHR